MNISGSDEIVDRIKAVDVVKLWILHLTEQQVSGLNLWKHLNIICKRTELMSSKTKTLNQTTNGTASTNERQTTDASGFTNKRNSGGHKKPRPSHMFPPL